MQRNANHSYPVTCILLAMVGISAVVFGALGAHALQGVLDARGQALWRTAVGYHFWHALAFSIAAFVVRRPRARRVAMVAFALGILLFSGSLYALALGAPHWFGVATPIGGVAFIIGWLALAAGFGGAPSRE